MPNLQKGDRVSFPGDTTAGTKAKGTVMQFIPSINQYEIHTDLGSVVHFAETDANGKQLLEKIEK